MNAKINQIMTPRVITTTPHKTINHVRDIMNNNKIGAIPVVNSESEPIGIVSSTDFVSKLNDQSPISTIMTTKVYTVPLYDDVSIAARIMRNHKIHHIIVTDAHKVVGIISSFDLLKLVEDHRFIMKNAPTESSRKPSKRR